MSPIQQCLALRLGCGPDREHEANLVHEVGNVVDDVQDTLGGWQLAEDPKEVSERVDGPANNDDQAHVVEVGCHSCRAVRPPASPLKISYTMNAQARPQQNPADAFTAPVS